MPWPPSNVSWTHQCTILLALFALLSMPTKVAPIVALLVAFHLDQTSSTAQQQAQHRPAPDWEDNFEYGIDERRWGIELTQVSTGAVSARCACIDVGR